MNMNERTYYSTEAANRAKRERMQLAAFAMLVGTGLGAILTLLFSPISSEEARSKLEDAVEDGKDHVEDSVKQVRQLAS
jgi:gas vesicle protein